MICRKCGARATSNGYNASGKHRHKCTNKACGIQFITVVGAGKLFKAQWPIIEDMLLERKSAQEIMLATGISLNWLKRLALASGIELIEP